LVQQRGEHPTKEGVGQNAPKRVDMALEACAKIHKISSVQGRGGVLLKEKRLTRIDKKKGTRFKPPREL